jgi:hypothetical protein
VWPAIRDDLRDAAHDGRRGHELITSMRAFIDAAAAEGFPVVDDLATPTTTSAP